MKKLYFKDNSGAAMLTVVIAVLFIVALGVALLTASYMGYAVSIAQKNGQANFYDAASAMDDVRAYVHTQASDALANAYTETLKNYAANSKDSTYNVQADFSQKYVAALESDASLMTKSGSDYAVAVEALKGKLSVPDNCAVTLSTPANSKVAFTSTKDAGTNPTYTSVSLKGLSLKYTDSKNYETTVSTDITINIPAFNVTSSVPHSLKEFSIVANSALEAPANGGSVAGNVYAGSVTVSGGGNVDFSSGDLLCGGEIKLDGSSSALTFTGDADGKIRHELWAKNITLSGSGDNFTIKDKNTRTYVKNDLSLNGSGNTATLVGEYTGFGGNTASTGVNADKDNSSAILIGGKNANLGISDLSKLTLAGVSFINPTTATVATVNTAIPMGQSVAVKTDQLAYLVPAACLPNFSSNPCYGANTSPVLTRIYTDVALWPNSSDIYNTKTLADYLGASSPSSKSDTKWVYQNANVELRYSQTGIIYAFLYFKTQAAANRYFMDYINANPDNIAQYLGYYLSGSSLILPSSTNTAGVTYSSSGANAPPSPKDGSTVSAAGPADLYTTSKGVSPYTSYVRNTANIKDTYEFYSGGNLVAVVTNGENYTYDQKSATTLRVIVSTKNVTIPDGATFTGVIIAGDTVTLRGKVTQPESIDWQTLLSAKTKDGKYSLSDFLGSGGTTGGTGNNWDLSELVVYKNWKKS